MVGALDRPPSVQTLQHYPTFLNANYEPEGTYELDEINQRFQRSSWEPRFPNCPFLAGKPRIKRLLARHGR
jgi:hypothetical protein